MYCPNCGNQIPDSAKFCPFCGQPLPHPKHEQQSPQNTQPHQKQTPSSYNSIKIFSYVFMAVYGVLAIAYAWMFIKSLFNFFSYFTLSFLLSPLNILSSLLTIVLDIALAAVFVFGVIIMFLQANHDEREDFSTYFNVLLIAVILQAGVEILVNIIGDFVLPFFWTNSFFWWGILAAVVCIIVYSILLNMDHVSISSFYAEKGFTETVKDAFRKLSHEISQAKEAYDASHPESAQREKQEQQDAMQAAQMHVILKTNRGIFSYVILTIITCGIYQLFWVHSIAKDVNIACAGDGKNTGGALKFFLFGILTCGIYDIYWWYALADRTQAVGITKYHLYMQHGGGTVLIWIMFGWLICGIGEFIGMYQAIQNANMICLAYNQHTMNNDQNPNINININQQ